MDVALLSWQISPKPLQPSWRSESVRFRKRSESEVQAEKPVKEACTESVNYNSENEPMHSVISNDTLG